MKTKAIIDPIRSWIGRRMGSRRQPPQITASEREQFKFYYAMDNDPAVLVQATDQGWARESRQMYGV